MVKPHIQGSTVILLAGLLPSKKYKWHIGPTFTMQFVLQYDQTTEYEPIEANHFFVKNKKMRNIFLC